MRDTSIKKRDNTEVRIAEALERIAAALEQANTTRVWPNVITFPPAGGTGGSGFQCATCRAWVPYGTTHYCTSAV